MRQQGNRHQEQKQQLCNCAAVHAAPCRQPLAGFVGCDLNLYVHRPVNLYLPVQRSCTRAPCYCTPCGGTVINRSAARCVRQSSCDDHVSARPVAKLPRPYRLDMAAMANAAGFCRVRTWVFCSFLFRLRMARCLPPSTSVILLLSAVVGLLSSRRAYICLASFTH